MTAREEEGRMFAMLYCAVAIFVFVLVTAFAHRHSGVLQAGVMLVLIISGPMIG